MSFLSNILGAAAPIVGGVFGGPAGAAIGGLLGGAVSGGAKQSGSTTATQQQQLDPRMQALLYGDGTDTNKGLLSQIAANGNTPRSPGLGTFGTGMDGYLGSSGMDSFLRSQQAAQQLQQGGATAPQMDYVSKMGGTDVRAGRVDAPAQNDINLAGAYSRMINGDAGANPYLTKALQSGVDQTNASFAKNQADMTNNLQRNVLPGIRSNSVLAGQYGGSRQGIAEGNAISDYTNQLNSGNLQLGLANSANTTGAQAQAFNQGQDRALSAMTGLSAQQYAAAGQNAQMQQAANSQTAGNTQQANMQNMNAQNSANQANMQSQLSTNQLNSANQATGIGLSSGLLGQASNYGTANDAYAGNKLGQTAGLLGQFAGAGASSTSTQPYYTNTAGSILGGATGALGLYNSYKQATGGANSGQLSSPGQAPAGYDWGSMLSGYGG